MFTRSPSRRRTWTPAAADHIEPGGNPAGDRGSGGRRLLHLRRVHVPHRQRSAQPETLSDHHLDEPTIPLNLNPSLLRPRYLRAYIQSSGVGARLCPAPHAGRLALGQNLGSLLHCHGAGQQRLVVQVLRPMHQHGDPTEWGLGRSGKRVAVVGADCASRTGP